MQSENAFETGAQPPLAAEDKPRRGRKKWLISVQALMFLVGLSILVLVIYRIGYANVLESISRVGWGFLIVIALNLTRHMGRALTMYIAVSPEHRTFKYRSAVAARLGGDAMNSVSFVGPFLGDATKAMLLKRSVGLTHGASAVIIDNVLYYVTVIVVILAGVATLVATVGGGDFVMREVLLGIVIVAILMFTGIVLAMMYRVKPLTHVIDLLERRHLAPGFVLRKREAIRTVESNVFHFYHERQADFFKIFAISMAVHAVSVTEVYTVLSFLDERAVVTNAFIIESLTKVINAAFSFIPSAIGVYEGGNGVILKTLGYTTAAGVALGLVRRGAILFSAAIGLSIVIWRTTEASAKRLANSRE
jgi:uncharacterized membrane protein YbhN (UPF0104 family)